MFWLKGRSNPLLKKPSTMASSIQDLKSYDHFHSSDPCHLLLQHALNLKRKNKPLAEEVPSRITSRSSRAHSWDGFHH